MNDASRQNQLLLQCLGVSPNAREIDLQFKQGSLLPEEPLLTYLRYDVRLEEQTLQDLGFGALAGELEGLRELSSAELREEFYEIGKAAGSNEVSPADFPEAFKLP